VALRDAPRQAGRVEVQVVCLVGGIGFNQAVRVPRGQTLGWAVQASGIRVRHPELAQAVMTVWGQRQNPETSVVGGERIELHLPCSPAAVAKARLRQRKPGDVAE
jgi:putative ubiquitin-RnfH superfamily antitoxin RatB of RatAB toxin-antitoxin module